MPWSRPTLTSLISQTQQDVSDAGISGVDGLLTTSVLYTLGYAMSGLSNLHYGYQDWIAKQATPWGATGEYAEGWGSLKGVTRKAATSAVLSFEFTGSTADTTLDAGSTISASNNLEFTTNADATVDSSGTLTVEATATETGTDYNLSAGTSVSLSTSVSGISSSGTVISVTTSGTDQETESTYKTRYLAQYASTPQGGAKADYVNWAEAVSGVTRAWCNPLGYGAGSVVVYIMLDDANSAYAGFPQGTDGSATDESRYTAATGDQLTVANALYDEQPVTALVIVCSPLKQTIDFVIDDLYPDSSTVTALIESALSDMMTNYGSPLGMTLYPSQWNAAISSVSDVDHFYVSSPTEPVTVPVGYLPVLGTVSPSTT